MLGWNYPTRAECDEAAKEQRAAFPKLLAAADRRSLLEMEFRMRLLEMHNIELEEHTIMRDNLMKERSTVLSDLKSQLGLRDRIISRQRQLLLDASVRVLLSISNTNPRALVLPASCSWYGAARLKVRV